MRYLIEAVVCVRRRECTWVRLSRVGSIGRQYRGTSLKRKILSLGPYSMTMPGGVWWP